MPALEGVAARARYPFLSAARDYVKASGFTLGDLLRDPVFERARRRSLDRVRGALDRKGIDDAPTPGDVEAEIELLSYPLARAVVATVHDSYLTNRYAVAEAKLLHARLGEEEDEGLWRVATELDVHLQPPADGASFARVHFLEYLRNAPGRDPDWKLVNQPLEAGFVSLTRERVARLAEEALKERILEEFETLEAPGRAVAEAFGASLAAITTTVNAHRARFAADSTGEIRVEAFPPCMRAIWTGIQKSVNVPHMGRFAIVTFLHSQGMDSEAILRFFATVPDFDVNKSRYQIEHITGKIGGGTQYTPPSCATMQTYGICPLEERDEICLFQIRHPLSYYRRKLRSLGPARPAAAVAPAADGGMAAGSPTQP